MKVKGLTILSLIFATALKVKAALTQEEKDTLLNLHREARAAVNASNMKEINWDNNLATIAQVIFFRFFLYFNLIKEIIISLYNYFIINE